MKPANYLGTFEAPEPPRTARVARAKSPNFIAIIYIDSELLGCRRKKGYQNICAN